MSFAIKMLLPDFGTEAFGCNDHDKPTIVLTTLAESSGMFSKHIFMLGLNKGEVPGLFLSDPLLTEDVRGRLQTVLPALRTRKTSYLNERHRLYSLFSACSYAHLSWVLTDELSRNWLTTTRHAMCTYAVNIGASQERETS